MTVIWKEYIMLTTVSALYFNCIKYCPKTLVEKYILKFYVQNCSTYETITYTPF